MGQLENRQVAARGWSWGKQAEPGTEEQAFSNQMTRVWGLMHTTETTVANTVLYERNSQREEDSRVPTKNERCLCKAMCVFINSIVRILYPLCI